MQLNDAPREVSWADVGVFSQVSVCLALIPGEE